MLQCAHMKTQNHLSNIGVVNRRWVFGSTFILTVYTIALALFSFLKTFSIQQAVDASIPVSFLFGFFSVWNIVEIWPLLSAVMLIHPKFLFTASKRLSLVLLLFLLGYIALYPVITYQFYWPILYSFVFLQWILILTFILGQERSLGEETFLRG